MKRVDISGLDKNRSIYLKVGFIVALGFVLMAFNYSSQPPSFEIIKQQPQIDDSPKIIRTSHEKKRTPPPTPPEPTDEIIPKEEEVKFEEIAPKPVSLDIDLETDIIDDGEEYIDEPYEEPIISQEVEELIDVVEEDPILFAEFMPMFGGCDASLSSPDRKECSDKALLDYFAKNIRYPAVARENGIEGKVILRFVVDKDGTIKMAEALRKVGGGCTEEAMRVLNSMPKWKPGRQGGRFVKVLFTVPVTFKLK